MQPIILEDMATEGIVFDVGMLTHYLKHVSDVRKARGQRYSLQLLLVLILLAKSLEKLNFLKTLTKNALTTFYPNHRVGQWPGWG